MRLSIIGSGVVGKATGIGFLKHGNHVVFHDIVKEKLAMLKNQGYVVTEDLAEAITDSEVAFVCVQTPTINGQMDLSFIENAIVKIAGALNKGVNYRVVVIRSTVLPSTTRTKIIPLLEQHSQLTLGKDFGLCVNPGFFRHKNALHDFLNPSRIVIGESDKRSGNVLETLYSSFEAPIVKTDLDAAEMIKYAANTFLATKISFFNEIFIICKKLNLDPRLVAETASLDPRIGDYGICGGRPFAGSCLPKDLEALVDFAKDKGMNPKLLDAVLEINEEIRRLRISKGENL